MGKIICTNKIGENEVCGCTYFVKLYVNEFKDFAASLYTTLQEVDVDNDIKLYRCLKCGEIMLPPVDHFSTSEEDKKIYKKLQVLIDGGTPEEEKGNTYRPIHPGTARAMSQTNLVDPANHGKLVHQP